jgi:hypothetical protein
MFNKSVADLTTADLDALLASTPLESVRLEFKRLAPGPDELLKKLSGFANTFGGYLVVGADEQDGRLSGLPGIEPRPNYRQTVIQQCASGVVPVIDVFVSDPIPTPSDGERVCYVIHVPESDRTPHFLNGRRGAYVRVDEHSHRVADKLATYEEVMALASRRRLLVERRHDLVERAHDRFSTFETQLPRRANGRLPASAQVGIIPRFPTRKLVDQAGLIHLAREVRVNWRSTGFPQQTNPLSQHESALLPTEYELSESLVEVSSWGLVSASWLIERSVDREGRAVGIHLNAFLGAILVLLEYAIAVYRRLGFEGPVEIVARLDRIRSVPVFAFVDGFPEQMAVSRFDDTVSVLGGHPNPATSGHLKTGHHRRAEA